MDTIYIRKKHKNKRLTAASVLNNHDCPCVILVWPLFVFYGAVCLRSIWLGQGVIYRSDGRHGTDDVLVRERRRACLRSVLIVPSRLHRTHRRSS